MPEFPRIAIVSDTAPPLSGGGIGSAHYNLFHSLKELGYSVELFTFSDQASSSSNVKISSEEALIHRHYSPMWFSSLLFFINRWVFRLLSPDQTAWDFADILVSSVGARRMGKAIKAYNPHIVILSDHGAPGLYLIKKEGMRFCLIAHHNSARFLNEPMLGNYSRLDSRLAVGLENRMLRKVDRVSCPSHHMKEWFERTYHFNGPVSVIPNIPDNSLVENLPASDMRSELGLAPDEALIGIPSGSLPIKGTAFIPGIIRGICENTEKKVGFFIGGGIYPPLAKELDHLPENAAMDLPGKLPNLEYLARMRSCSFGIFPSLRDNYSMSLVEATLNGIPMIAFDAGGNADIILDGQNGYLIPDLNAELMAEKAVELISKPNELAQLRERTKLFGETNFRSEAIIQEYIEFFIKD